MGYRSEVKVLFDLEGLNKNVKELGKEIKEKFEKKIFDDVKINTKRNLILCEASWVKWYDCYDEVKSFYELMSKLEEELEDSKDGGIHFLRIGENIEDVEERIYGYPNKWLQLERYIGNGDFEEEG